MDENEEFEFRARAEREAASASQPISAFEALISRTEDVESLVRLEACDRETLVSNPYLHRVDRWILGGLVADVAAGIQVGARAVTAQIGPVPQSRARVGLANAIRLTQAVKGTLRIEHEPFMGKSEDDLVQVKAELYWPLAAQEV